MRGISCDSFGMEFSRGCRSAGAGDSLGLAGSTGSEGRLATVLAAVLREVFVFSTIGRSSGEDFARTFFFAAVFLVAFLTTDFLAAAFLTGAFFAAVFRAVFAGAGLAAGRSKRSSEVCMLIQENI